MSDQPKTVPCQDANNIYLFFSPVNHEKWNGRGTTSFEMGGLDFCFNYFGSHRYGDNAVLNSVLDINNQPPENPETYNHVMCLTRDEFSKYTGRELPEYFNAGRYAPA